MQLKLKFILYSSPVTVLLNWLLGYKMLHMSQFFQQHGKCHHSLSPLILVLIKLVDHEEILCCEMLTVVVLVVPILVKKFLECDDEQILSNTTCNTECKYQCNFVLLMFCAFFKQYIMINGIHFPNFWSSNFDSITPNN